MKVFIVLCIALLFLSGCGINQMPNTQPIPNSAKANNEGRYLRITLKSPSMGKDELPYFINDDTSVHIKTEKEFSTQMPIYEIKPHYISGADFQKMQENLEIKEHDRAWWCKLELDKNTVTGTIAPFDDIERGYYANLQWTDEELEAEKARLLEALKEETPKKAKTAAAKKSAAKKTKTNENRRK